MKILLIHTNDIQVNPHSRFFRIIIFIFITFTFFHTILLSFLYFGCSLVHSFFLFILYISFTSILYFLSFFPIFLNSYFLFFLHLSFCIIDSFSSFFLFSLHLSLFFPPHLIAFLPLHHYLLPFYFNLFRGQTSPVFVGSSFAVFHRFMSEGQQQPIFKHVVSAQTQRQFFTLSAFLLFFSWKCNEKQISSYLFLNSTTIIQQIGLL